MSDAAGLIRVSVYRRPAIWLCVDPEASDDDARWMLEHGWIDPVETGLLLDALPEHAKVLDACCGVGVFALAAAAAGAEVIAIDPDPANVELVRAAARRNGFERLRAMPADDLDELDLTGVDAVRLRYLRPGWKAAWAAGTAVAVAADLREAAGRRGRPALLIDRARDRVLVPAAEGASTPYADSWFAMLDGVPSGWRLEPALEQEQIATRLVEEAASALPARRARAARGLARCPHPSARAARAALALDLDAGVRASSSPTAMETGARAVDAAGTDDLLVRARALSLPGLSDAYFHLREGQHLALLAAPEELGASALIEAVAGLLAPTAGTLEVRDPPTLVRGLADALQPGLSVAQNLELLTAFVGGDVTEVDRHMAVLARRGGYVEAMPLRLLDAGPEVAQRLMLSVALDCAPGRLIVLDLPGAIEDAALRERTARRTRERLREGVSIVQRVCEPRELVGRPDRALWISGGAIVLEGHAESLSVAFESLLAGAPA